MKRITSAEIFDTAIKCTVFDVIWGREHRDGLLDGSDPITMEELLAMPTRDMYPERALDVELKTWIMFSLLDDDSRLEWLSMCMDRVYHLWWDSRVYALVERAKARVVDPDDLFTMYQIEGAARRNLYRPWTLAHTVAELNCRARADAQQFAVRAAQSFVEFAHGHLASETEWHEIGRWTCMALRSNGECSGYEDAWVELTMYLVELHG